MNMRLYLLRSLQRQGRGASQFLSPDLGPGRPGQTGVLQHGSGPGEHAHTSGAG